MPNIKVQSSKFKVQSYKKPFHQSTSPSLQKGYTLVELLVVISIIGILATVGIVLFGNTQKNTRDARRRGDIETIGNAMELNYGKFASSQYSAMCESKPSPLTTDCSTWFGNGMPIDPVNDGVTYYYTICSDTSCPAPRPILPPLGGNPSAGATPWVICAKIENPQAVVTPEINGTSINPAFYCTSNKQ